MINITKLLWLQDLGSLREGIDERKMKKDEHRSRVRTEHGRHGSDV